ncbi:MAG: InlB B-repeat-containing protein [Bacilli bacterium]|nr:InlB B-repeat-containing protein [Bacilli bacterium]
MKKGSMVGILVLILLLVVGFATISTNVIINTGANLSFNENYFNVIFTEATTDGTYTISEDKQEINYATKNLSTVGDKAIIEYKVKNDSYQYDANVLVDTILNSDSNADKYNITYEILDSENSYSLESKRTVTAKVIVELIKSVSSPINISMKLKLNLTAVGRTTEGVDNYTVIYNGNGSTSGSMANQEIEFDKETQLLANTFVKTNYTFGGWSTTSNGVIEYLDNENILNLTTSGESITLYAVWVKTTTTYNYYGAYQIFNTPQKGYYQIEVYGGAGGGPGNCNGYAIQAGGYGGYAKGTTSLNRGQQIYIVVGGKGGLGTTYGFNGGGYNAQAGNNCGGAGGGATHVAAALRGNGQLSNYASYQNEVLIAAGAGGGGALSVAGAAGGTNSGKLYYLSGGNGTPTGPGAAGTGYTHHSGQTAGSFGKGGNGGSYGVGAGGSGFYGGGGGAHITPTTSGGGGGGSTYIKSTLTNQSQTAGVNSGNGYVIITFISGLK